MTGESRKAAEDGAAWDLFGEALRDFHLHGRCGPYAWRRDDGLCTEESIAFYFAELREWKESERECIGHLHGRTLDVGCGAGKHLLELARRGVPGAGVDASPHAVDVCRARGLDDVRCGDAFALPFEADSFDATALFTNNLSLGGSPRGVCALLAEACRVTRPGGALVLNNLDVRSSTLPADVAYREANLRAGRLPGQVRMRAEYDGRAGEWIDWLFVTPDELAGYARDTGWEVAEVRGTGGPYWAVLRKHAVA